MAATYAEAVSGPLARVPRRGRQPEPDTARVHTVEVDDPEQLLERLPADGALAWVRGGEGLVAWGEVARFEVGGAERFSRAQRWWSRWCSAARIFDRVQLPGTGPIAFASFGFDSRPGDSVVIVPRVVLGRRDGRAWLTVIDREPAGPDSIHDQPGADVTTPPSPESVLRPVSVPQRPGSVRWAEGTRNPAEWETSVAEAVARICAGELDKVVLARDVVAQLNAPVDVRHLLVQLADRYPACWTFSVDGLVGATPELLVRRTGDRVMSRVLAGTVRRRGEESLDAGLAEALLASGKDLSEHEYAVHSVADALAAYCTDLDVPARPHVLRLANVQHLATDVSGQLADGVPVLALAAALHPTAAVCGTPTERALGVIRELEGMDRGRYAGPVGWFDAHGDGELGIALRCAQVSGDTLRLFAGCGIVAESDPAAELAESAAKLVAMRDAIESD